MRSIVMYLAITLMIAASAMLTSFAPDMLTMAFVAVMVVVVVIGAILGVIPLIQYTYAFRKANDKITRARDVQSKSPWLAVQSINGLFDQKALDGLFDDYKAKVERQRKSGEIISNIEEDINEDVLGMMNWQNVVQQIPGTLTGIGLLGTFAGLIMGVSKIEFSSVDAAINSVQGLLGGIQLAFYTSIAGVILSLLFNMEHKMIWNVTVREMNMFLGSFHKNVIPRMEEQSQYRLHKELQQIIDQLDRLPKGKSFTLANAGEGSSQSVRQNEQILMPQILRGLQENEFTFYLQPRFDLNTQRIIGAEALARWRHKKMGVVSPSVFIPVLENNGYITKLDQYIWEQVCITIRRWLDAGLRPVPISVNVSKTDILAIDIVSFFSNMVKKYRIPPRALELDIVQSAYVQAKEVTLETEAALLQAGFRVVVDGFDGDFMALNATGELHADAVKLDLRSFGGNVGSQAVAEAFQKAGQVNMPMIAEGIENMEQVTLLRKQGCQEGQGYYFSKPVSVEMFEKAMAREVK